jgi:AcrR family transcriptional regulator
MVLGDVRMDRREPMCRGAAGAAVFAYLSSVAVAEGAAAPPVDLGRSVRGRILDATIDISAETGYVSVTPAYVARRAGVASGAVRRLMRDRGDFVADVIDRLFERRIQTYYANAARLDSQGTDPMPGLDAMARQFPDAVWIAYWDILFAIRGDAATRAKVQKTTTKYDNQFLQIVPRFFPEGTSDAAVNFVLLDFDATGLVELTHAGEVSRARRLEQLAQIVSTTPAA